VKRTLSIVGITLAAIIVLGVLIVGSGALSVAADEPHSSVIFRVLETARERSIAARADDVEVPASLDDAAMVRRGAGNYDGMCAKCHLAPGMEPTELSAGLSPTPPNLAKHAHDDPAEAFWVIKHGIKATGMPAWGKHMQDLYIWDVVALLRKLPSMSAEQYQAEVSASGGHSHGGGESAEHTHEEGEDHEEEPGEHHSHEEGSTSAAAEPAHAESDGTAHIHADGTKHVHSAPASGPVPAAKALHEAMSAGDAARVQTLLDPKVIIMEGGNVERSLKEYAGHHLPADLKFMKGVSYKLQRQTGDSSGDLAWVASEAQLTGSSDGKPVELVSTETLVLKKVGGAWKVVHIHWSSKALKKA
jgi:mono/diheme cytochrome c family protein/ketosteroid isomerase-like protein